MKYTSYALLFLLSGVISCNDTNQSDKEKQTHKTKSIEFEEFKLIDLTPKAPEEFPITDAGYRINGSCQDKKHR